MSAGRPFDTSAINLPAKNKRWDSYLPLTGGTSLPDNHVKSRYEAPPQCTAHFDNVR